MAVKQVEVPDIGIVKLYKRRNSRSIKIALGPGSEVRVSMPNWLPYKAGLEYVKSKAAWINANRSPVTQLESGALIGKAHRLKFASTTATQTRTRISPTEISVYHPSLYDFTDNSVQQAARQASLRALKQESETLLPQRLRQLATKHGFAYESVRVKNLRSRWGSCNQQKHIALNIFLMQLPWPLIDYVLLHELTHTEHLNHSRSFWSHLETCLPNYKQLRKELKTFHPAI